MHVDANISRHFVIYSTRIIRYRSRVSRLGRKFARIGSSRLRKATVGKRSRGKRFVSDDCTLLDGKSDGMCTREFFAINGGVIREYRLRLHNNWHAKCIRDTGTESSEWKSLRRFIVLGRLGM